jgi:hypothetical protein
MPNMQLVKNNPVKNNLSKKVIEFKELGLKKIIIKINMIAASVSKK